MEEKKVKGTMLLDFVKMVKVHKNLDWNKHLKPEDWELINAIILPSKWYPLDFFKRCSTAAFVLLAGSNLEMARTNGQMMAKHLFETTYKTVVQSKDPMRALSQFVANYATLFNFSLLKLEKIDPRHVHVLHDYDPRDKGNIAYCHQMMGMFETMVQMTGGKDGKVVLAKKQWEGAPATIFDITWE
jgi:uncharacterized protein (TIGR02265 family)